VIVVWQATLSASTTMIPRLMVSSSKAARNDAKNSCTPS
jgi:hypothetical protein